MTMPHQCLDCGADIRTPPLETTLRLFAPGFSCDPTNSAMDRIYINYDISDQGALAVGNSWTYEHNHADRDADYSQWSTYTAQHPKTPQFTIEVVRTEELDGQTYYVISDEQALYRFDGVDETGYTVSTDAGWEVAEQPPL